ncbi:putative caffeoyl-CoA O-methyltransferase [Heracleum sosnowskyi]|uniref:Caffeoyl-CoA O-methyltransferase n=1 Tax=Heracleum sosnowskyi TaxID=360622 RepID=A0AAD8GV48_9APIA|nr:putative caffeoyl-CoA O-methyltransferase [Heracleum sosnowskyi]
MSSRKRKDLSDSYYKLSRVMENEKKEVPSPNKGLLQSPELYQYILESSVYPNEPEPLKELRAVTASHPRASMGTAPDAGQMMSMLLQMVDAKRTIEIGVFTGYSLLRTALTIPYDGKIIAVDMNLDTYEIGLPIIRKAGVEHKINFIQSEALSVLDKLLETSDNEGSFDFAYVDSDKINYLNYHERLLKLLKVGGVVVYDNTLWGGTVAMPEEHVAEEWKKPGRHFTLQLNKFLASDSRIQICLAPFGDGMTICKRLI